MAIKKVITTPNNILDTKSEKVKDTKDPDIVELVKDLKDTLEDAKEPEGAGLAAPQIGSNKRICVVRNFIPIETAESREVIVDEYILINPKIVSKSDEMEVDFEGCLSVPDQYGEVERHKKVKIKATNEKGEPIRITASGFFARTIQHEIDHLDGILFTSKVMGETISEEKMNFRYEDK